MGRVPLELGYTVETADVMDRQSTFAPAWIGRFDTRIGYRTRDRRDGLQSGYGTIEFP